MTVFEANSLTKAYREKMISLSERRISLRNRMTFNALGGVDL